MRRRIWLAGEWGFRDGVLEARSLLLGRWWSCCWLSRGGGWLMNLLGWSCCEVWMLLLGMMVGVGYVIWVGRAARLNC